MRFVGGRSSRLGPYDKHPADVGQIEGRASELGRLADQVFDLKAVTDAAFRPAEANWEGVAAAELRAAPEPLRVTALLTGSALAWAAVALRYWASQVRAFNTEVDEITSSLTGQARNLYGARGTGDEPPTSDQIAAARADAEIAAAARWHAAYERYVAAGSSTTAGMLEQGPTKENLARAREVGAIPGTPGAFTVFPVYWSDAPELESLKGEGGLSGADLAILLADLIGIFDPTPVSDGVSGLMSLFRGDFSGAGLSAMSMVPYVGDALGKSGKLAKLIKRFEHLAATDPEKLLNTLKKIDYKNPDKVNDALRTMNRMNGEAAKRYANPAWSATAEKRGLPTDGPVPFVPPKNWQPHNPQREMIGGKPGFVDAYGNVWTKGPGRGGDDWEWDVQVGKGSGTLQQQFGDGRHVNVSRDGQVTHNPKGK